MSHSSLIVGRESESEVLNFLILEPKSHKNNSLMENLPSVCLHWKNVSATFTFAPMTFKTQSVCCPSLASICVRFTSNSFSSSDGSVFKIFL